MPLSAEQQARASQFYPDPAVAGLYCATLTRQQIAERLAKAQDAIEKLTERLAKEAGVEAGA